MGKLLPIPTLKILNISKNKICSEIGKVINSSMSGRKEISHP